MSETPAPLAASSEITLTGSAPAESTAERLADLGVLIPDVMLPRADVDLAQWAVVACDQYTSEPEYWEGVENTVGEAPSTLRLVLPEVYLEQPDLTERIESINSAMSRYLTEGILETHPATAVLVRRTTAGGVVRWGLMVALDLEAYDWHPGSHTLIRATEGTIESRIPPRKEVRRHAPLELPHIMVLISDAARSVIEPLAARTSSLEPLYATDLMAGGGRVEGWAVTDERDLSGVADALATLADALDPANPLLFAMGDGNHSLATAKSCWEDLKAGLTPEEQANHPARYALVELENIFDAGLLFEPIHRVVFGAPLEALLSELASIGAAYRVTEVAEEDLEATVADQSQGQRVGVITAGGTGVVTITGAPSQLAAGTLTQAIDALVAGSDAEVDYIHGGDVTIRLGREPGNIGVLLPPVAKETFFDSIVADGALPRKTFSMGHANDKRYYLEARAIR